MLHVSQKLHRDLPPTTLYAFGRTQETASYPGPTIVVAKGVGIQVNWTNHLLDYHMFLPEDPTLVTQPTKKGVPLSKLFDGDETVVEALESHRWSNVIQ